MENIPKRFATYDFGETGKHIVGTNILVRNPKELSHGLEYVI